VNAPLADAVARAPRGPGVYVFIGERNRLLYIGKARDIRRRLSDHSRSISRAAARTRHVRWIECADEAEALCLEADLVVSLAPPFNASMVGDSYEYVCVRTDDGATTFTITGTPSGRLVYGGFPHLGKGKTSWPAVRSKAGFSALLRLLWVANGDTRFPSRLHGDSPPVVHTATVGDMPAVRAFFSGGSRRLLTRLAEAAASPAVPDFMRGRLRKDLEAAEQFYWLGPCRSRTLRRRHGLRNPVSEESFRNAVSEDLRRAIGAFTLG
jgi:hypothetical protein